MRNLRHPANDKITLSGILAALSDPFWLSIVARLADRQEHSWSEHQAGVGLSTLSHHAKVLREAGLIDHRQAGTRCFLKLCPDVGRNFSGALRQCPRSEQTRVMLPRLPGIAMKTSPDPRPRQT
jgi:DNA-binding transcriptional ArsR family regulator